MPPIFSSTGAPTGYGQISPFRKTKVQPAQPTPQSQVIQQALMDDQPSPLMPRGAQNPALPKYPLDPSGYTGRPGWDRVFGAGNPPSTPSFGLGGIGGGRPSAGGSSTAPALYSNRPDPGGVEDPFFQNLPPQWSNIGGPALNREAEADPLDPGASKGGNTGTKYPEYKNPRDTNGPGQRTDTGPSGAVGDEWFAGFDFQRAQDPSYSAKDSFAQAAHSAPTPPPVSDKAALTEWFNQYIAPAMQADGHVINWVEGDKMNFTSPQGTFTVDWVVNAGIADGKLAWQVDGPGEAGGGDGGGDGGGLLPGGSGIGGQAIGKALAGYTPSGNMQDPLGLGGANASFARQSLQDLLRALSTNQALRS